MTTKRVPPPKVRPYEKKHMDEAQRFIKEIGLTYGGAPAVRRKIERDLASKFGQWEEHGWNGSMMNVRRVMEAITFAMTPTHFTWALKRVTGEFNDREKEKKA